jgi:hypothetical protein
VTTFIFGCGRVDKERLILAKINNYRISGEEFEDAFKDSSFGRIDTLESRKEFLESLINQKLILQDAQARGLDKKENFLKMIERFWEQSLLKIALDKKTKEIAGSVSVSDGEIEDAYKKMFEEGKTDKPYDSMYSQIKWELTRRKENETMSDWIIDLHKKADIKTNYDLLKKE